MTARPATAGRLSVKIFPPLPPGEAPSFRQRSEVRGQRSEGIVTRPPLNNPHALTIRRSPLFHPRHPRNPRFIFAVMNQPTPSQPGVAPASSQRSEVRGQRSEGIVTRPRLNNPHAPTVRRSPLFHPRLPRNPRSIFAVINHPHAFSTRRSPLFHPCSFVSIRGSRIPVFHLRASAGTLFFHSRSFVSIRGSPSAKSVSSAVAPLSVHHSGPDGDGRCCTVSFPLSGRGATASLSACKPKRPSARAAVPGGPGSSPFWSASRALSFPCPCGTSAARRSRARSRRSSG